MNDAAVLSCQGLSRSFTEGGLDVDVLRDVSLTVTGGQQVAIGRGMRKAAVQYPGCDTRHEKHEADISEGVQQQKGFQRLFYRVLFQYRVNIPVQDQGPGE